MDNKQLQPHEAVLLVQSAGITLAEFTKAYNETGLAIYKPTAPKTFIFDVNPNPKPRMTKGDKIPPYRPCVSRYWAFATLMQLRANKIKYVVPPVLSVDFIVQMPRSWSKKKKAEMNGTPHQQKPDLSNFMKAFEDVLCKDDSYIWSYKDCNKFWGETGRVIAKE